MHCHEYNIRPKRTGGGVSIFIADSLTFTRRNDIKINSIFNSITLIKSNKDIHTHFTRQANHFRSKRGNTEFVYRTFAFQSVFIWNKIIQNIDINVHITRFKHLLKEFLLSNDISFRYTK